MKRFGKPLLAAALGLAIGSGLGLIHGKQVQANQSKIAICHGTASDKNPYVLIRVDLSAVNGHFDGTAPGHGKNNYPDKLAQNDSCPTTAPTPTPPNNS